MNTLLPSRTMANDLDGKVTSFGATHHCHSKSIGMEVVQTQNKVKLIG